MMKPVIPRQVFEGQYVVQMNGCNDADGYVGASVRTEGTLGVHAVDRLVYDVPAVWDTEDHNEEVRKRMQRKPSRIRPSYFRKS